MIIAVEGADKSGKRTQVNKIVAYLRSKGIDTEQMDFPRYSRSPWGDMAAAYLRGEYGAVMDIAPEYKMLPYSLDRMDFQKQLNEWLAAGKWVVFDRYTYSNAFSVAACNESVWDEKIKYLETMEFDWMGVRRPDLNIYLYVNPKVSFDLKGEALKDYQKNAKDIHEHNFDLLKRATDVYRKIANDNPNDWMVIDQGLPNGGRMTEEEVFDVIKDKLDNLIKNS
ncbi:MAG: hypothetical protein FWC83_01425 [Alphaproteobacteria bacterium]|nr:hypothetical protein [Alphaproteobacteria bacterium]